MARKVQAVVNPALWRYTDAVDWKGRIFTHDEPVALTEEEYEELSKHVVDIAGRERQLVVLAEGRAAARAEQASAPDEGENTKGGMTNVAKSNQ